MALVELGDVHRIFGEPDKALPLYERSQVLFEKLNMVLGLGFHQRARGDLALESKRYSDALEHYKKFEAYAREDSDIWAINQSRGKIALANAYLGDIEQARREMGRALAQTYAYHEDDLALESFLAEAVCLLKEGSYEDVIELVSYLQRHPASWNETRQHARAILETASSELDQEVVLAAIERGKVLDFDTLIAKLTK